MLRTQFRKALLVSALALAALTAVHGSANAQPNPDEGEIAGPWEYVIRANPAVTQQAVVNAGKLYWFDPAEGVVYGR